jgi:L-threonine-O-3-phosphate decarboxylase
VNPPPHGGNVAWAATIAGCPASALLDFSASINPLGPPPSVMAAIQGAFIQLCHYPDPTYSQLRSQLSCYHQVAPEWILPGNGSAELLTLAGRSLAQLSSTVMITPAFGDYYRSLAAFDGQIVPIPWPVEQSFPLRQLQILPLKEAGLLLNNPHNPTGYLLPKSDILPLLSRFKLVLVDEAFMDFLPPENQHSLVSDLANYPNLIILRSLTKFYSLPGLRFGYALGHPEILQQWQAWRDPWPVNVLAEAAAIAALQDQHFQQQTWNWLTSTKQQLQQALSQLPGLNPLTSAANFLLVQTEIPASQLQKSLLINHQILIRDCLSFPELGDRFFRVAVRTELDNQRLIAALGACLES